MSAHALLAALCSAVYLASFPLVAVTAGCGRFPGPQSGWRAFGYGLTSSAPSLWHVWLANPVFWAALAALLLRCERTAACLALAAALLGSAGLIASLGLTYASHLVWGYWLWLGSMAALTYGSLRLSGDWDDTDFAGGDWEFPDIDLPDGFDGPTGDGN